MVKAAKPEDQKPFYAACGGMIKFHLLEDKPEEQLQLKIRLESKGGASVHRVASKSACAAFVAREPKKLMLSSRKVAGEFWANLEKASYPTPCARDGEVVLDAWSPNAFWPWPEFVLLRMQS